MFHKAGAMVEKAYLLRCRSLDDATHSMPFLPELVRYPDVMGERCPSDGLIITGLYRSKQASSIGLRKKLAISVAHELDM